MTITTTTTTSINTITHLAKPSLSASSKDKISKLLSSCLHSVASSMCGTVSALLLVYLHSQRQEQTCLLHPMPLLMLMLMLMLLRSKLTRGWRRRGCRIAI